MAKIDDAVRRIVSHISDKMTVPLARDIERKYGETGNGHINANSLLDYSQQYLSAYIYDQLACVFDLEE